MDMQTARALNEARRQMRVVLGDEDPGLAPDPSIRYTDRPMTSREQDRQQAAIRQERIDRARASLPSGRSAASPTRTAPRLGRSVRSRVETRGDSPGQAQVARIRASGGDARECGRAGCKTVSINAEGPADVFCYDHS